MTRNRRDDLTPLVAAIYEAAVDPSQWPHTMRRIAESFQAHVYVLGASSPEVTPFLPYQVTPDADSSYRTLMTAYTQDVQLIMGRTAALGAPMGTVVTRPMFMSDGDWQRLDCYDAILRPLDLDNMCVLLLDRLGSRPPHFANLSLHRSRHQPRFTPADTLALAALYPHLRRAAEIHQRLQGQETLARAALEALDRLPSGMLLVSATGQVLHANAAAEAMLRRSDGLGLRHGQLFAADPKHTARLYGLIAEAIHAFGLDPPSSGGAMPVPRPSDLAAWQVTVSPLAPNNPYVLGPAHAAVLVTITDPSAEIRAPEATLRALFGLTSAETRIALALANGKTPGDIAVDHRLSLLTVRTHIRRLHDKLGVRHQGQLIRRVLLAVGTLYSP
jgi:DNA-binding CsgD family transcriptional regulator/PAS domain-containing protein